MSEFWIVMVFLAYIAIGVFTARLLDDEDAFGFTVAFWPGIVLLGLAMLVLVIIPCWFADKIRKKFKRR